MEPQQQAQLSDLFLAQRMEEEKRKREEAEKMKLRQLMDMFRPQQPKPSYQTQTIGVRG